MSGKDENDLDEVEFQLVATGSSAQIIAFPRKKREPRLAEVEAAVNAAAATVYAADDDE